MVSRESDAEDQMGPLRREADLRVPRKKRKCLVKNFKNSVLVASAFAALAFASPSFAIPSGPITGGGGVVRPPVTVPGDPVIGDPVATAAELAAYDAADEISARKDQAVDDLTALRQAAVAALNAAANQGAEFNDLSKIAKQYEKQMRKVVKVATKDMKKLFKQGSKAIKAAGGGESNINYLAERMSEDQGDLSAGLTSRLSTIAWTIENLLDRP